MSDNFEMLVDVDATLDEAEKLSNEILDRFRRLSLIYGELNADCVLGGMGYRPGPAVPDLYDLREREGPFWNLVACGVEPQTERGFNMWALGPECEGFICTSCNAEIKPFSEEFGDSVGKAIGEWFNQTGQSLLKCPRCDKSRPIAEWQCKPPLGFGNLSYRFWNWPPLDWPAWKIDIAAIFQEITGHNIVRTHGHI